MLRLIIADDETDTREGLAEIIPWADYGIQLSGLAATGRAAYDLIMQERPDIVLIDIQMPGMTGLEVISQVRQEGIRDIVFIILSGHDEFSYAQQAVTLNVDEYLLKPFGPEELIRAVQDAILHLTSIKQLMRQSAEANTVLSALSGKDSSLHILRYPGEEERGVVMAVQLADDFALEAALSAFFDVLSHVCTDDSSYVEGCLMLYMELLRLLFARGLSAGTNYFYDVFSADNLRQSITLALASAARDIAARLHASQSANSLVSRAVHYIDEHYCEPDLSLDTVAAAVYASPAYLSSLFRQNIGMSFVDYIHDRRIEAAKKLLAAPELTLDEIAERLGYSNVKYFSRVFKKAAGLPPSQYRSQTFG